MRSFGSNRRGTFPAGEGCKKSDEIVTVSFQHRQVEIRTKLQGLPVPEPHNDDVAGLPRGEAEAEVKRARWPLVVLALGGLATLAWTSLLAWLVSKLVMWFWN